MQKRTRKIIMLLAVVMLMMVCFAFGASAERAVVDSGNCGAEGDNVIWTLYDDGELVISGEGAMKDYGKLRQDSTDKSHPTEWEMYSANINNISIADSVIYVGKNAFTETAYFKNEYNWQNNTLYIDNHLISVKSVSENFIVNENTIAIAGSAFNDCEELKSVVLPSSLISIGYEAFSDCYNLTMIEFPQNLTIIGDYAFECCKSLENVVIPDSVEYIGDYAFRSCDNLSKISIGKNVKKLGYRTFDWCKNLESIMVEPTNGYFSNDDYGVLFDKTKTLLLHYPCGNMRTSYIMPNTVKRIEDFAFCGLSHLDKIVFSDDLEEIGIGAFTSSFISSDIYLPESMKTLRYGAFLTTPFLSNVYVKSNDLNFDPYSICRTEYVVKGISREDFVELSYSDDDLLESYIEYHFDIPPIGTIHCHSGSTAEAYAIENGIHYELIHFFEGEWTYDYDNMIRTRKCIHCDELETESIEVPETPTEPENPDIPDTTDCDCICHETGFLNRILAFVYRLFIKLLGTAKNCDCGVAHY